MDVEARVYFGVKDELEARGQAVSKSEYSYDPFFSMVHVAATDPATGRLGGAADPRGRGGLAIVDWESHRASQSQKDRMSPHCPALDSPCETY